MSGSLGVVPAGRLATRLDLEDEGMTQPLVIAATPDPTRGTSRPPTFGLWPVSLCEYLRAARLGGVRKVVQWTDSHDGRLAMFPIDQLDPFFNVKIPEDLAQAKAMI